MADSAFYGSDIVTTVLDDLGCRFLALNPGASLRGLHDSLVHGTRGPEMIVTLHEEIAVAMAHGYAKMSGTPMAVGLHDTVGLLHGSMALFNAWVDRVPVLALIGTGPLDAAQRRPWIDWIHTASDQTSITRDFAVWTDQPFSVEALDVSLRRAWRRLALAPSGPALIGLDVMLQEQEMAGLPQAPPPGVGSISPRIGPDPEVVRSVARAIEVAERPVIVTDRPLGSDGFSAITELAERLGAGLVDGGSGSCFRVGHPYDLTVAKTEAIRRADYLLFVDVRDPGWMSRSVASAQRDEGGTSVGRVPAASIGLLPLAQRSWLVPDSGFPVDHEIVADPGLALSALVSEIPGSQRPLHPSLAELAGRRPVYGEDPAGRLHASAIGLELAPLLDAHEWTLGNATFGSWIRETLRWSRPGQFLGHSGGAGLGYGLGASLGAGLAVRGSGHVVVDIQGDGDLNYTPQALWTAAHHNIPVLIIVDGNASYMRDELHQAEVARLRGRASADVGPGVAITGPMVDVCGLARAYGVQAAGPVTDREQLRTALESAVAAVAAGEPALVAVDTSSS